MSRAAVKVWSFRCVALFSALNILQQRLQSCTVIACTLLCEKASLLLIAQQYK